MPTNRSLDLPVEKRQVVPVSLDLPRNPFAFEVLDLVSKQKTAAKKAEVLKRYEHPSLKSLFIWNFDETVISMLPEGEVPFRANDAPEGTEHSVLSYEARKLWHYIEGGDPTLSQNKRETMFVQLLESLHPDEADILVAAKDKVLHQKYKGLSKNVVMEAFDWDDNYMVIEHDKYPQSPGAANG